ncbi:uncharacterized protein G2W53_042574 [Senna tora]|uniref:Uncharacterized protein n=1 Tax=Senna tora TaxID=362788 RepID=A0A834VZ35_9FABA|nr:uncharacterized protein G2W53_042574 [Senna tora]
MPTIQLDPWPINFEKPWIQFPHSSLIIPPAGFPSYTRTIVGGFHWTQMDLVSVLLF